MTDARVAQMAEVLTRYSLNLKSGDKLAIRGSTLAEPLIKEVYRAALRAGAQVVTQISLPGLQSIFMDEANDEQLSWVSPFSQAVTEMFDAFNTIQDFLVLRALKKTRTFATRTCYRGKYKFDTKKEFHNKLRPFFIAKVAGGEDKWEEFIESIW